jgi:hypothetical protein
MARIFPEDYLDTSLDWIYPAEHDTLLFMKEHLSDQYEIFHSVHWTNTNGRAIYGEIDFLILHPNGRLLAIEQKNIEIESRKGQLLVRYQDQAKDKNVYSQIIRNIGNLRSKFAKIYPKCNLQIDHILYLPTAIFEGMKLSMLVVLWIVPPLNSYQKSLQKFWNLKNVKLPQNLADYTTIREFLLAELQLTPAVDVSSQKTQEVKTFLSRGLSEWVKQIQFEPFRLFIQGTAGCGKTQLALSELKIAEQCNLYGFYLCFNRPLLDSNQNLCPKAKLLPYFS